MATNGKHNPFTAWLKTIKESNWDGSGMNSPHDLFDGINLAILKGYTWDTLPLSQKRKYAAVELYQGLWAMKNKQPTLPTPDFILQFRRTDDNS